MLDLSTPEAALDAGGRSSAARARPRPCSSLGEVGDLVADLLGLDPPRRRRPDQATALLADPLAAVGGYWADLIDDAAALGETLGSVAGRS